MHYKSLLYLFALLSLVGLYSCEGPPVPSTEEVEDQASTIIKKAIEVHGVGDLEGYTIQFAFRERMYRAAFSASGFQYERIFNDSSGLEVQDVLHNEGFHRLIAGERQRLSAKDSSAYSNSVNSVLYFALLPRFLTDPAVQTAYLGEGELEGQPYYKIGVTFEKAGGGKDFQDEFVYWFHKEKYTMDYLAYNYETDGGGARFRKAINQRTVEGLAFADFINYKPIEKSMEVVRFDQLYTDGQLKELSRILLENILVSK